MRAILLVALGALAIGCGTQGVGDPCNPAPPPPTAGEDAGYFLGSEVYIETRSLQCRTRVCMVYKWDQRSSMNDRSKRVFCTCRCGGDPDQAASFCACPEKFTCVTVFVAGDPGIRGAYCVREEIAPPDAGM